MAASIVFPCRTINVRKAFLSCGGVTYCQRVFFSRHIKVCAAKTLNCVITPESRVDKEVVDYLQETCVGSSGHIRFHNHLGIMRRSRAPQLPVRLIRSMKVLLEKYPIQSLETKTQQLMHYLQARHPPISKRELAIKTQEVEDKILSDAEKAYLNTLEGEDLQIALDKHKKKVLSKLRSVVYHWQPMQYDAFTSYVYLMGRMSWDYAVILQCFTEISKRDKDFKPTSIYCHGSKVGSSIWAADTVWKKIVEHFCVDSSSYMNTIARLLLQDGNEQADIPCIKGVVLRQFQPSSKKNKFSLVVSPYMLMEQASAEERLQLVHDLWEMTENYLVLIENGTNAGFSLIDESREFLLSLPNSDRESPLLGHVFAPCPHDKVCPKKVVKSQSCLAETTFLEVGLNQKDSRKKVTARYSYLIMKKGPRTSETEWPRVLLNGQGSRHLHCHLCLPSGQLQHVVISKGKYDKYLYNCAKKVQLGDRLPVTLSSTTPDTSMNQDQDGNTSMDNFSPADPSSCQNVTTSPDSSATSDVSSSPLDSTSSDTSMNQDVNTSVDNFSPADPSSSPNVTTSPDSSATSDVSSSPLDLDSPATVSVMLDGNVENSTTAS